MIVGLSSLLLVLSSTAASDAFCSCPRGECFSASTCCPNAFSTCSSGQILTTDNSYDFQLPKGIWPKSPSPEDRRTLAYAGIRLIAHGGPINQRWFAPLWEEANHTVTASGLVEIEELYRTAAGFYGALMRSANIYTLILNGDSGLYKRCEASGGVDDCFPLVLEPAVETLTRLNPPNVAIAYTSSAREAAALLANRVESMLPLSEVTQEFLADVSPEGSCVLLCATQTDSKPHTKQKSLLPTAYSEYRYLPMPGAAERITWLMAVASVVVLGTLKGSYKLSMA